MALRQHCRPSAIGKTTVALAAAHALLNEFDEAVFFVDLGATIDPKLVPTTIASALGSTIQGGDPHLNFPASVGDKRILLVLDNCEHVIDEAAAIAEQIIRQAPRAHILATSREALRAEGEHVHLLRELGCPPGDARLTAAEALRYPAAQLFMERAAASGYDSELSDADAPIVASICHRLDGIALAIELAASFAGFHGIRGTVDLLGSGFRLLWQIRRTAPPRHQTLNAMLDWSYNLLSDREKVVLCRLSALAGDFTLDAAGSIASELETDDADISEAVASLVAKSLVSTTLIDGATYYRLLNTTRSYAAAKLAQRGEADHIVGRQAIFYPKFRERDQNIQLTLAK